MGKVRCDLCGITIASEKWMQGHLEGKQHQRALEKSQQLQQLASRSVFLDGFKAGASEDAIRAALQQHGHVDRVILDKRAGKFAIVEFASADAVTPLLEQKRIQIGQERINVKKRRVDFKKHEEKFQTPADEINAESVLKTLDDLKVDDFRVYLTTLYNAYKRDPSYIVDGFIPQLSTYVQSYFRDEIQIQTFGSTTTGFALHDSDVDLCFISTRLKPNHDEDDLRALVEGIDLMTTSIVDLNKTKISLSAFNSLKKPDQVKLLTRILNEFRKETSIIGTLTAVPDARIPVVRFSALDPVNWPIKLPLTFEISVNNFLGVRKSEFVRNALNDDLSLILFAIRLWGRCVKLFQDPKEPTGHWTSYALSLIFVHFCQLQYLIGPVVTNGSDTIGGWSVQYDVQKYPTTALDPRAFLLDFFKYAASAFNKPIVLSLKKGRSYSADEFKKTFGDEIAEGFKMSLVNVQDPLELKHNVTANVSAHYLSLLRSRCMAVIYNLKATEMPPIRAIFAERQQGLKPSTSKNAPKMEPESKISDEKMDMDEDLEPDLKRRKLNES